MKLSINNVRIRFKQLPTTAFKNTFMVSGEYIVAPEMGPMFTLNLPMNIEEPCVPKAINLEVDKNQSLACYGLQSSRNGFLWIVLQEAVMPQPKGKLTLLTTFDFQKLLKCHEVWRNDSITQ